MKISIPILLFLLTPAIMQAQADTYLPSWSREQADSLKQVFNLITNDTMRMQISRELGVHYQERNRDSSLYFHELELFYARKLKQNLWEADALDQAAWVLSQQKNYPLSLQYFSEAIKILEKRETEKNIWKPGIFSPDKDPVQARMTALGFTYNDLSQLFDETGEFQKELKYLFIALRISREIGNLSLLSLVKANLAKTYLAIDKPDSALVFGKQALLDMEASAYWTYKGYAQTLVGNAYLINKEYGPAKLFFEESVRSNLEHSIGKLRNSYSSLSDLYRATGQADSSIYYANKALVESRQIREPEHEAEDYSSLYQLYLETGRLDSAFLYLQRYKGLSDSLNKAEKAKIYDYLNIGFNEQINLQEQERVHIQRENRIRTYMLLAGIGGCLLIALLLFRNNRNRKKANKLLQEQKDQLETTLAELKAAQAQLIQSEKMASLGELTAGIAHEIQNPLNFINNFSEINTELLAEMSAEIEAGDLENVRDLAIDITGNEEKINYHGKRANSIVQGMLQHSRISSGQKEPTRINELADEYLRLAYHGIRARDKTFNASFDTDFDETIGPVDLVPQDISRVLLNLITNAFYAVNERRNSAAGPYEPRVTVSTKNLGDKIEISVSDNGNGIPGKILDKIFQPFFTTKPTGQGTGLGLSLAYDIVKAHGGELKVESREGSGASFSLVLPAG